jgi:DNA-binding NtrC family response regulator
MALLLIIDEERDSCVLMKRVLIRDGYSVATFTRSGDALKWLEDHSPDLSIVSAGKHGETAKELLGLLKEAGVEGTDIVLSAGAGALAEVRKAFSGVVRDVLVKPVDLENLEALVRSNK